MSQVIPKTGLYKTDRSKTPWTDEEDAQIKSHYPHVPKIEGKERRHVKLRATYLGCRLSPHQLQEHRKKFLAAISKRARQEEKTAIERNIYYRDKSLGQRALPSKSNRMRVLREFSVAEDIKILELWPELPRIPRRTRGKIEERYRLLKKLKVTKEQLKTMKR